MEKLCFYCGEKPPKHIEGCKKAASDSVSASVSSASSSSRPAGSTYSRTGRSAVTVTISGPDAGSTASIEEVDDEDNDSSTPQGN